MTVEWRQESRRRSATAARTRPEIVQNFRGARRSQTRRLFIRDALSGENQYRIIHIIHSAKLVLKGMGFSFNNIITTFSSRVYTFFETLERARTIVPIDGAARTRWLEQRGRFERERRVHNCQKFEGRTSSE